VKGKGPTSVNAKTTKIKKEGEGRLCAAKTKKKKICDFPRERKRKGKKY